MSARGWWTPRMVGAHLLALVCMAIAVGFGVWQWDAWQVRRDAEQVDLTQRDPVALSSVLGPDDPFPGQSVGQPVRIDGTWLPDSTVLIDGRETGGGQVGRWVVTPLTTGDRDDPAVPVVRGWVAPDEEPTPPPTGTAEVVGWLQPSEGTGAIDDDPTDDVLPQLRVADLVQRTPGDLYAAYVVLDNARTLEGGEQNTASAEMTEATLDQLPQVDRFTALRNLLYAIEWFVFAGFAGFVWWRYVRDERARDLAVAAAAAEADRPEGDAADEDTDAAPRPAER
ncbi:SURF1 family protein [Nocardioides panacisoli]|uniref:SURF1 family protein n=1 Tax=Nocardioides panacisoli TaxID=627624 RepID=UPI001C62A706|nr:SURF1 family protein [Nocardioides panacisoli]QYJ03242.1 SURF1 family protein [Nocardioides panacisoli]